VARRRDIRRARSALCGVVPLLVVLSAAATGAPVEVGFTAFPFELSSAGLAASRAVIRDHGTLYAIHDDRGCVPWEEALRGAPLPAWIVAEWDEHLAALPAGHALYLAITPTRPDRRSLAGACGPGPDTPGTLPPEFAGLPLDSASALADPDVRRAFLAFAARAVAHLQPRWLNIGIEMSELALAVPSEWSAFEGLADFVREGLKAGIAPPAIGVSYTLQSLLDPAVAAATRPLADRSDFLGISFYPFATAFGELEGAPPLPAPPAQWNVPFDFLATFTTSPIAIAETGYPSRSQALAIVSQLPPVSFPGSDALQRDYVRDLARVAARDGYLFIVWFVPIDYDVLADQISLVPFDRIWTFTGLFSSGLVARPALAAWRAELLPEPGAVTQAFVALGLLALLRCRRASRRS